MIHELRKLRGTEEFLDRGSHWLGVDQFLRGQAFRFSQRQTFFHCAFNADQADAEYVFGHFADRTNTTVTQMIDIVHGAATIANFAKSLDHFEDIGSFTAFFDEILRIFVVTGTEVFVIEQNRCTGNFFTANATVELHATDVRQVITFEGEEQVIEQVQRSFFGWRLTRTHHAIDFDQRFELGLAWIDAQGVGNVWTTVQIIHPQGTDLGNACFTQFHQ